MRSSETFLSLDHGFNTIVHVLDEIYFGAAESTEVGNIVDTVIALGMFAMGATDLDVVLVSDCLELVFFLG